MLDYAFFVLTFWAGSAPADDEVHEHLGHGLTTPTGVEEELWDVEKEGEVCRPAVDDAPSTGVAPSESHLDLRELLFRLNRAFPSDPLSYLD